VNDYTRSEAMYGFSYVGKVTDNQDPDGLNRIKVSSPQETETDTEWIPYMTPFAGEGTGFHILPNVDAQVFVCVLDALRNKKIAIGGIWDESAAPPVTDENTDGDLNQDGKNTLHFIKSASGNMLIFDDTEDDEKMQLISAGKKSRLEFLKKDELINFETEKDIAFAAKKEMFFDVEKLEIKTSKECSFQCKKFQVSSSDSFSIESDKDVSVKGSSIALN